MTHIGDRPAGPPTGDPTTPEAYDPSQAPTVVLRPMRGWVLLYAGLLVWSQRLAATGRRHGPRLVRMVQRSGRWGWHQVAGTAAALAFAGWLWGVPVLRAVAASPRWSEAAAAAGARARARRVTLIGLGLLLAGVLVAPLGWVGTLLLGPGLTWAGVRAAMAVYPHTTRGRIRTRYGHDGWLTFWDHHRHLSAHAARQTVVKTRPSITATLPAVPETRAQLAAVGPGVAAADRARRLALLERLPITECGTWVGTTAVGPVIGLNSYIALRDSLGLVAPPQTGKSQLLIHHIVDHVGAVVSTSTKPDLYLATAALRALIAQGPSAANGAGVLVFNPQNLGGIGSNLRFSPTRDCSAVRVARRNAGLLIGGVPTRGGDDGGDRWDEWSIGVLACLLMAADRAGLDMSSVAHWVFTQKTGAEIALRHLRDVTGTPVPPLIIDALSQVTTSEAKKTRDAIFWTLTNAVRFMEHPDVAAVCCPGVDEPSLDVTALVRDKATLYVLGSDDPHAGLSPLLACLTGIIFDEAALLATHSPGEVLDPPLLLALDEAALITPVPLDRWLADAGGRGIQIIWAVQSRSQLEQRWGVGGARTIWNTTNAKLVYGGLTDHDDLNAISALCGMRHELVPDPDGNGPGHARFERVPVCPPDRLRVLPRWHALLIHRDVPATIVRLRPGYQRPDVRRAGRPSPLATPTNPTDPTARAAGALAAPEPAVPTTRGGSDGGDTDASDLVGATGSTTWPG